MADNQSTDNLPTDIPLTNSPPSNTSPTDKHLVIMAKKFHTCVECGKEFMTKSLLNRHLQSHTGEKPHVCTICGNQYTQSWSLKTHMAKHNGETGKAKPTGEFWKLLKMFQFLILNIIQLLVFEEANGVCWPMWSGGQYHFSHTN